MFFFRFVSLVDAKLIGPYRDRTSMRTKLFQALTQISPNRYALVPDCDSSFADLIAPDVR